MTHTHESTNKCTECGSLKLTIDERTRELVCRDCGLVNETLAFADGNDALTFDNEGKCQNNPDKKGGLGSTIGYTRTMPAASRARFNRLRIIQKRQTAGSERALKNARLELNRICVGNRLPNTVRDYAENVYVKAAKKRMIKGRTVRHVLGVGIYEGCQKYSIPRTLDMVSDMCSVSRKELARDVRILGKGLRLKNGLTGAEKYVGSLVNGLNLDSETVSLARKYANESNNAQIMSGKSPVSIAAASIYLATIRKNCRIPQTLISKVTGVSCPTIKRVSDDLEKCLTA